MKKDGAVVANHFMFRLMDMFSLNIRHLKLVSFFLICVQAHAIPEIIPHRGGKAENPENIIQSFEKCIELGAKTLELDVQVTKDGVTVVYHPKDLSANTNGKGNISDYTYDQIKKLDAAYNFKSGEAFPYRGKGHTIPTLKEVLLKFPDTRFIIDLKSQDVDKLMKAVKQDTEETNAWDRVIFYSTSDEHLDFLKKYCPKAIKFESRALTIKYLLSPEKSLKLKPESDTQFLGFELERDVVIEEKLTIKDRKYPVVIAAWTKKRIDLIKDYLTKVKLVIFGINSPEAYKEASDLGVDAVFTDNPKILFTGN